MSNSDSTNKNITHKGTVAPKFHFEIPTFSHWKVNARSEPLIQFIPDKTISVRFEVPPNIAILINETLSKSTMDVQRELLENPKGVMYQSVFVKGFSRKEIQFKANKASLVILPVEHLIKYGLDGYKVEKTIIETFEFE